MEGEQLPKVLLPRKIDALAAFENLAATAESRWATLCGAQKQCFECLASAKTLCFDFLMDNIVKHSFPRIA